MSREQLIAELQEARDAAPTEPDLALIHEMYDGAGERERQRLGIDGTPGDAQDRRHRAYQPDGAPCCLVCGFSAAAVVHS